jgi:hypothetical protein
VPTISAPPQSARRSRRVAACLLVGVLAAALLMALAGRTVRATEPAWVAVAGFVHLDGPVTGAQARLLDDDGAELARVEVTAGTFEARVPADTREFQVSVTGGSLLDGAPVTVELHGRGAPGRPAELHLGTTLVEALLVGNPQADRAWAAEQLRMHLGLPDGMRVEGPELRYATRSFSPKLLMATADNAGGFDTYAPVLAALAEAEAFLQPPMFGSFEGAHPRSARTQVLSDLALVLAAYDGAWDRQAATDAQLHVGLEELLAELPALHEQVVLLAVDGRIEQQTAAETLQLVHLWATDGTWLWSKVEQAATGSQSVDLPGEIGAFAGAAARTELADLVRELEELLGADTWLDEMSSHARERAWMRSGFYTSEDAARLVAETSAVGDIWRLLTVLDLVTGPPQGRASRHDAQLAVLDAERDAWPRLLPSDQAIALAEGSVWWLVSARPVSFAEALDLAEQAGGSWRLPSATDWLTVAGPRSSSQLTYDRLLSEVAGMAAAAGAGERWWIGERGGLVCDGRVGVAPPQCREAGLPVALASHERVEHHPFGQQLRAPLVLVSDEGDASP